MQVTQFRHLHMHGQLPAWAEGPLWTGFLCESEKVVAKLFQFQDQATALLLDDCGESRAILFNLSKLTWVLYNCMNFSLAAVIFSVHFSSVMHWVQMNCDGKKIRAHNTCNSLCKISGK